MSYEPTVWKDGDLVTSAKLNKIEQGIASHDMVEAIVKDGNPPTFNKTWQEILDNNYTNVVTIIKNDDSSTREFLFITSLYINSETYYVEAAPLMALQHAVVFSCNSPDGYPVYDEAGGGDL